MNPTRVVLLQVVRLEDPGACEPACRALRRRFPGCVISLPAPYAVARVGHIAGVDRIVVVEPGFRKATRQLAAERFDAACIGYEWPSLPGPLALEVRALMLGTAHLLAAVGGELRGMSRARLALRVACGLGIAALCAVAVGAISPLLFALLALGGLGTKPAGKQSVQ
jgi:hypothetical protein